MSDTVVKILGEEKEVDLVAIHVSGEGAGGFREFMKKVAAICNAGSSRTLGIVDADGDESKVRWDFDGDGSTRLEIREE